MAGTFTSQLRDSTCGLCETKKIGWKCTTCNEWMCGHCRDIHLRSRMARNHKVIAFGEAENSEVKNGKGQSIFNAADIQESFCKLHKREVIQMYCQNCQTAVCRDCITGDHLKHAFCKVEDILEEKRKELSRYISESKEKLNKYEQIVEALDKSSSDFSAEINNLIDAVKAQNSHLKAEMDNACEAMTNQLKQREKQIQEELKTKKTETNKDLLKMKSFIKDCENKMKTNSVEIIDLVAETKLRLDKFEDANLPDTISPPVFTPGSYSTNDLEPLLGELELDHEAEMGSDYIPDDVIPEVEVNLVSSCKVKGQLNLVAAIDESKAWVGYCGEDGVKLINADGQVSKTVKTGFSVHDLAYSSQTDELFMTVHSGSLVKKMKPDLTFEDIYKAPAKYVTRGLCVADDGSVLVCIYSMEQKIGAIHRIDRKRGTVSKIQFQKDGKTPLFVSPVHVRRSKYGELCVLQRDGSVVLVDADFKQVFRYHGKPQNFDPKKIEMGEFGHVFVSDCDNSNVHLLDRNGQFLQYVLTKSDGLDEPLGISLDRSGKLWVCSEGNNRIFVAKYLSDN